MCPLYRICKRGKSEEFNKVMRIIQSYGIAGDILPKEPLLGVIGTFLEELEKCNAEVKGKAH